MENQINNIRYFTHFDAPEPRIQQFFIETVFKNYAHSHCIKFSFKENLSSYGALHWVVIESLEPFQSYTGAWMLNDCKSYMNIMIDVEGDEFEKYYYNKCVEFCKKATFEDLLSIIFEKSIHV